MSDHRDDGRLRADVWQLLNQAEVRLPGISQAALRAELYDVMRIWFDETNSWQESINFLIVPNTTDYPIVPTEGRITRLLYVIDKNLVPQPASMPVRGIVSFRAPYNLQPGQSGQTMTARVVKNVTEPFTNRGIACFPTSVLQDWGHYILDGLVGRAMLHPKKSWSDPQLGVQHYQRFRDGEARCRADTAKQNLVGGQAWWYPQQWRTRNQRGGVSVTGSPW
jgi:hypothetical protein